MDETEIKHVIEAALLATPAVKVQAAKKPAKKTAKKKPVKKTAPKKKKKAKK